MEKNVITLVSDFRDIKFMDENRVVDKITSKRMKSLKQAILERKYMPPVLIDTDYYILDGQHRTTAALSLIKEGHKVYLPIYMIDPADTGQTSIEIARTLNSTQKKWSVNDYEKSFASEGNSSYVACARLTTEAFKEFGIKLTISSKKTLLGISGSANNFYSGNIHVTDEDYQNALKALKEFFDCSNNAIYPMNFSVSMADAFMNIRKHPFYEAEKLQEYLEQYEIEWPDAGSNPSTFIGVFKEIINAYSNE